jgi:predicted nucleic acid-binding protein
MPIVVIDASVTLPWCFADEATPQTNALLTRLRTGDEAAVPGHWPLEVANALRMAGRRGRISEADISQFLEDIEFLPIRIDTTDRKTVRAKIYPLAEQYGLTTYDAAYLELAMRDGLALATLDHGLLRAARLAGVRVAQL